MCGGGAEPRHASQQTHFLAAIRRCWRWVIRNGPKRTGADSNEAWERKRDVREGRWLGSAGPYAQRGDATMWHALQLFHIRFARRHQKQIGDEAFMF